VKLWHAKSGVAELDYYSLVMVNDLRRTYSWLRVATSAVQCAWRFWSDSAPTKVTVQQIWPPEVKGTISVLLWRSSDCTTYRKHLSP